MSEIQQKTRIVSYSKIISFVVAIIGVSGSLVTAWINNYSERDKKILMDNSRQVSYAAVMDSFQLQFAQLRAKIDSQKYQSGIVSRDSLSLNTTDAASLKKYLDRELSKFKYGVVDVRYNSKIDSLDHRLRALEDALMEDPSKALAIPLLRKELENVKDQETKDVANVRAEITSIYDLNKWFIGLMFTMAIGILSLAISNFLPRRDKSLSA